MLSTLCVRLTIKVKVGIPESFQVGWCPPQKTGSSHLKRLFSCFTQISLSYHCLNSVEFRDIAHLSIFKKQPRTQTSLFRCARKGRREGDNGRGVASPAICTLPMVPCCSSPVSRFALTSAMRKPKRLRRRMFKKSAGRELKHFQCVPPSANE